MRDITQQQVEQHIEKQFVWLREKLGRDAHHPERKGVGSRASGEEPSKEMDMLHLHRSVLPGLCLPSGQIRGFFFQTWLTLGPFSGVHTHPSAKMDLKVKASGRSKTHYGLELSPGFWPQEYFRAFVVSLLSFTHTGFLPFFVIAMIIPLRCLQAQRLAIYPASVFTSISESK